MYLPRRSAMANNGATSAYVKHRKDGDAAAVAAALSKCKKVKGRFIDAGRRVCEGPPNLDKSVVF